MIENNFFSEKQLINIAYFEKNLGDYLKDDLLKGKFVVIFEEKLKGVYDTFDLALNYALTNFAQDEFIIQQVIDNKEIVNFINSAV